MRHAGSSRGFLVHQDRLFVRNVRVFHAMDQHRGRILLRHSFLSWAEPVEARFGQGGRVRNRRPRRARGHSGGSRDKNRAAPGSRPTGSAIRRLAHRQRATSALGNQRLAAVEFVRPGGIARSPTMSPYPKTIPARPDAALPGTRCTRSGTHRPNRPARRCDRFARPKAFVAPSDRIHANDIADILQNRR